MRDSIIAYTRERMLKGGDTLSPVSSIRTDFHAKSRETQKRTILERGFFLLKAMILQGKYVPEPVPVSMTRNTVSRELLEQKVVAMAWRNPQIISYKSNTYEMADCLA
jgi:hypothetical protein